MRAAGLCALPPAPDNIERQICILGLLSTPQLMPSMNRRPTMIVSNSRGMRDLETDFTVPTIGPRWSTPSEQCAPPSKSTPRKRIDSVLSTRLRGQVASASVEKKKGQSRHKIPCNRPSEEQSFDELRAAHHRRTTGANSVQSTRPEKEGGVLLSNPAQLAGGDRPSANRVIKPDQRVIRRSHSRAPQDASAQVVNKQLPTPPASQGDAPRCEDASIRSLSRDRTPSRNHAIHRSIQEPARPFLALERPTNGTTTSGQTLGHYHTYKIPRHQIPSVKVSANYTSSDRLGTGRVLYWKPVAHTDIAVTAH